MRTSYTSPVWEGGYGIAANAVDSGPFLRAIGYWSGSVNSGSSPLFLDGVVDSEAALLMEPCIDDADALNSV